MQGKKTGVRKVTVRVNETWYDRLAQKIGFFSISRSGPALHFTSQGFDSASVDQYAICRRGIRGHGEEIAVIKKSLTHGG